MGPRSEDWAARLEFLEPGGEGRDLMLSNPPKLIRASLYLMTALVGAAFLWAWFSEVDIYITSVGSVRPEGDLVKVQAPATGRMMRVDVEDGQQVAEGDVLFVMDRRESETALGQVETDLDATRARLEAQGRSFAALSEESTARLASARIAIENARAGLARAQEEQASL
ncbi:MAG: biotin/lipoyl-binding protein, partial [Acidobacteriota bacterium]